MNEELERLRALSEAASKGRWHQYVVTGEYVKADNATVADCRYKNGKADAAFIVAAVNYVRDLLARDVGAGPERPDFMAADRALAVTHREDDQPCGCDDCMSYGAEDSGFDWYKVAPARRIVLRVLDSGDERLAPIATAFREHEEAAAEEGLDV